MNRKSNAEKFLAGVPGNRPLHTPVDLPKPATSPRPHKRLRGEARKEWLRVAPYLFQAGLLASADIAFLENYCRLVGLVRDCHDVIQRDGMSVKSNRSAPRQHPALRTILTAMPILKQYADALGLNAKARGLIAPGAPPPDEGDDLLG